MATFLLASSLLLLWKPITWTELLWGGGGMGGFPNDRSTDVDRCIDNCEPDEDLSADEQRVGKGGRPPEATKPFPLRKGLLQLQ